MNTAQVFWFTGLSGIGKTTLSEGARDCLKQKGYKVLIIDGDVVRQTLHKHLGFTPQDIIKNNTLIAELCVKNRTACDAIFVPIISPYAESRTNARNLLGHGFYEIYLTAKLSTLKKRDPKGLYEKARNGNVINLIGVSSTNTYEAPKTPDLIIDTGSESIKQSLNKLSKFSLQALQN